jgi:hypothetical protein
MRKEKKLKKIFNFFRLLEQDENIHSFQTTLSFILLGLG